MANKPSIPRGTRDFSPIEMVRRNYIFDTIKRVFQRYGYQPIETPAMENLSTLLGKYGEEGDRLLYRILNSGDFLSKSKELDDPEALTGIRETNVISDITLKRINHNLLVKFISEKGLRYDLTVPFARFVVQHQNEITFPFKRYQIQPVWRADSPQKGRYREFFQCDADVIGSDSLLNEIELIQIMDEAFKLLHIPVTIKINNRKVLSGIAETVGQHDKLIDITVAIDKLEKIGKEGVRSELREKGIDDNSISRIIDIVDLKGLWPEQLNFLKKFFSETNFVPSSIGLKGVEELETIWKFYSELNIDTKFEIDVSLARGLNYYTGAIFEVKANAGTLTSSITGGGRYDDLTGIFGLPNVSGVGISFGIDRIFDVMNELNLFDKIDYTSQTTKLLFAHFGEAEQSYCIQLAALTRAAGINTEIYPDVTKKIGKQFDYANKKGIPYVVVIGGDEMKSGELTLKDMSKGEQQKMKIEDIIQRLKK